MAIAAVGCVGAAMAPVPQAPRSQQPSIGLESVSGNDSFARYCSSCHGPTGRGDGPVAGTLRTRPADLTQLARGNNGSYPAERVRAVVAGFAPATPTHGSSDMPVWGPIFKALDPSDVRVAVRIENIVEYVGRMQEPATGADSVGARLFVTYCASCHGKDGRGHGIVTGELRHAPPDLTKFTASNGGVFPRERLYRIIDGRGVAAHGDRDMPVWGDAFARSRENLTDAGITARIDAIVGYLEAIQERAAE